MNPPGEELVHNIWCKYRHFPNIREFLCKKNGVTPLIFAIKGVFVRSTCKKTYFNM